MESLLISVTIVVVNRAPTAIQTAALVGHPDGTMTGVSKNYFPLNAVLPGDNPVDALVACAAPFLQEYIKNLIWLYGSQNTTVLCEELKWRLPLGLCMMLHGLVLSEHATFVAVPSPIASIFESIGYDIPSSVTLKRKTVVEYFFAVVRAALRNPVFVDDQIVAGATGEMLKGQMPVCLTLVQGYFRIQPHPPIPILPALDA